MTAGIRLAEPWSAMQPATALEYGPPKGDAEIRALADVIMQSLTATPLQDDGWFERWTERARATGVLRVVRREGTLAGGLTILPMGQWFGGKAVSVGAISAVAVAPEHRTRGVGGALMREVVREMAAQGTALSVLYPATQPLYRRVGYEPAGTRITYALPSEALPVRHSDHDVRVLTEADHPAVRELYTHRAKRCAGWFDRSPAYWTHRVFRHPRERMYGYLVERGGVAEGYVVFTQQAAPRGRYEIHVQDLCAVTAGGCSALVSLLAAHRSMAPRVVLHGGLTEPLPAMLTEPLPGGAIIDRTDWMLRVVDVAAALEGRGYPLGVRAEVHLDVADDLLPDNNGRFVLTVSEGAGTVKAGGDGGFRVDVRALAALYTGWRTPEDLLLAGQATLAHPDGARSAGLAAAVFAGPSPSMPDMF